MKINKLLCEINEIINDGKNLIDEALPGLRGEVVKYWINKIQDEINKNKLIKTFNKLIDENKQLKTELKFHKKHSLINNGKW